MMKDIAANVSDISTGRAPLQINIDWPEGSNSPRTTVRNVSTAEPSSVQVEDVSSRTTSEDATFTNNTTVPSVALQPSSSSTPNFRLSTHIHTITDLYREWTVGLGGNHSVEYMNTNYPGWYTRTQKTFYMRRRKIIKTCEEYAKSEGIVLIDAVRRAEMLRIRNESKSLDFLSKNPDFIFALL